MQDYEEKWKDLCAQAPRLRISVSLDRRARANPAWTIQFYYRSG
jgi:hypothetical protein